ncbi:FAD-dependent oxidoreductase [Rhodococcus rhodochrous]|uniref:FAD-dependent oxidoreductase n=1 Tax=Rhodococcus rhodochrous TaxID=1829 RepID=A0AA46WUQ5_RHORH|nr:FAD-dependent oxidoreductase [Rhodococcus rhodochrous]MCB8910059.1 FAD-dependent oxidoreductase [Rhodococcus rhodochrous]UZF44275.1 FAD-dependent oxidoreductase [Rhodococcus rhodochrous]
MSDVSVRPVPESEIPTWDLSADVVVAGYGIAGVTAAVEAARAGADVLVLERSGGWGGAASMAGGFIYLGGGTPLQKACGFDDTVENMKAFMKAALGPATDDAKIDAYCEGSVDHYNWLVEAGVPFKEEFWGEPGWEPAHDEGLMYSGGENAAPFKDMIPPAPRGHLPQMDNKKTGERGGGYMLMKPLVETAEKLGVKAEYDVRVQTVVVNGDGRVVGVVARRYGETLTVRARRGVVLAMGSFAFDEEMVRDYAPVLVGRPGSAVEAHDGRAIRIGQALGAATAHMDAAEVAVHTSPQLMVRGILVNAHGQRFIAEDTYPGRIGQAMLFHQNNEAFLILDQHAYDEVLGPGSAGPQPTWVCETAAELETEMGLPAGALTSTVTVYNTHAESGADPLFSKHEKWVRPIGTPIAAFDLRGMTSGFPLGGLKTDTDSRVLHVSGEPIAGLFAAGRCTAGVCAGGYASGASLGDGSFFGRRAGIGAARG